MYGVDYVINTTLLTMGRSLYIKIRNILETLYEG